MGSLSHPRRIVLTGGPGAGKTTIAGRMLGLFPGRFVLVPEAATQVFRQLHVRWSHLDVEGRRDIQRRIYQLQLEQESQLDDVPADRIVLLDRGTVDGAAYWPDGPDDFWRAMHTTHEAQLARYDAVIHLQTCAARNIYDGAASNTVRHEDAHTARRLDQVLHALWMPHPRFHAIPACPRLDDKCSAVRTLLATWDVIEM